ncbi:peptide chain release factor N(5)-glutamine methyltransferase [Fructobacillus sp. M158]|uniref:peptide chain release factor N(5)-glutamine methyltransferase n=1 Tax=Fructobacillus parabroussonetiae TaxID=2713174 RepID=UPI00200AA107|nr:peptide chain release factor N(5)-glutamine methyltransferase [Fructobacillus parabroussonetiae]MCK8617361.1 peptide chain release factor N(5)-glutamine methyltransferase [Fructobacillus parabroussonetiae]
MVASEERGLPGLNETGMGRFDRQAGRSSRYPGSQQPQIALLESRKWALSELTAAGFSEEEAIDNIDFLLTGALKVNYGMLRANLTRVMPAWLAERWPTWMAALIKKRPAQYVIGEAPFYGRDFLVDERVLIPRPETELLVDWVLQDLKADSNALNDYRLLDIGTGSGAIALTLAGERPDLTVTAADISREALAVAWENRKRLGLTERVTLVESDLLAAFSGERFDIIVSNPPYIRRDGQAEMDESVLAYEPDLALYADHDGLALYERMAAQLPDHLTENGRAYFEIGYDQGAALVTLFKTALPTASVELKKDLAGLDRMIRVELHGNETL